MLALSDLNDTQIIDDTFVYKGSGIHFRSLEQGLPLIFIHGLGAPMDTWRFLVKDLGHEFRLVFIDLRATVIQRGPPDSRYSIEDQADAVFGLMEHLGIKSAVWWVTLWVRAWH